MSELTPEEMRARLVGAWSLAVAELFRPDGTVIPLFGSAPVSRLLYTDTGDVSTHIMPGGDPPDGDPAFASPPVSLYSYCGTYRVEDDSVYHDITVSMNPGWVGATLRREVSFDGEDLILTTNDSYYQDLEGVIRLRWRRAQSELADEARQVAEIKQGSQGR
ncbi:MAG: lipocalin-like domain-containing protein [Pseudomonadota bacterium]